MEPIGNNDFVALVAELVAASHAIDQVSPYDRARMLFSAAQTIEELRWDIAFSGSPGNDSGKGEIAHDLTEIARMIDDVEAADIAVAMQEAADTLRAALILLDEKQKIMRGEA